MENLKSLKSKVEEYTDTMNNVSERRRVWVDGKRESIFANLEKIEKEYDIGWRAGMHKQVRGMEQVYLSFGSSPAGIIDNDKMYIKIGGSLNYAQATNGSIIVMLSYPFIEEIPESKREPKVIGKYEPIEIDEKIVIENVKTFLEVLMDYESGERQQIM